MELGAAQSVYSTHATNWEAAPEAAMPLFYLPLIMYTSWMEFLAQPFKPARELEPRLQPYPIRKPTD